MLEKLSDKVTGWKVILVILFVYSVGFFIFYPEAMTVADEILYIRHAVALSQGSVTISNVNPFTGQEIRTIPSIYPIGTSLLLTPFVLFFGWKGAYIFSLLMVLFATLITARWISDEYGTPLFALLFMGFIPVLVLGRVPMSDLPSAVIVVLALWLFWRGRHGNSLNWFFSGLLAGASLLFRETNVLIFLPLFIGSMIRREKRFWAVFLGGVIGVSLFLIAQYFEYGDPLFLRERGDYDFTLDCMMSNSIFYFLVLMFLIPGGIIAGLAYRGKRRPEIVTTFVLVVVFYASYCYSGGESGGLKQLVLGSRFFLPLIPLLAFEMAEVVPRLWTSLIKRFSKSVRGRARRFATVLIILWIAGICTASFAVHLVYSRWTASQTDIQRAIYNNTDDGSVIVVNHSGVTKFVNEIYGNRIVVGRKAVSPEKALRLLKRYRQFYIVFLERSDSEYWKKNAIDNSAYMKSINFATELIFDNQITETDRLRIWRIDDLSLS